MGRLARRFGGTPVAPRVESGPPRALEAVALENAVEGCVRETFGALLATFQAKTARDPEIAECMRAIARDETRHAALSWEIGRWAWERLGAAARADLVARCREAIRSLRDDPDACLARELAQTAGLPDVGQRLALIDALEEQLWTRLDAWSAADRAPSAQPSQLSMESSHV
jgi:hypothetical protein